MQTYNTEEKYRSLTHFDLVLSEKVVLLLNASDLRQVIPDGVLAHASHAERAFVRHSHMPHLVMSSCIPVTVFAIVY